MFSKFGLMGLSFGLMAGAVADVVVTNTLAQFPNNSASSLSSPENWTLGYADDDLHRHGHALRLRRHLPLSAGDCPRLEFMRSRGTRDPADWIIPCRQFRACVCW